MPQPPPVGKRPMLDHDTYQRIVDMTRQPELDVTSPDGKVYECVGMLRHSGHRLFRKKEKSGKRPMGIQVGMNTTPHGELLTASVSYPNHLPSWMEMKDVRYAFFPADMPVMMVFPDDRVPYINDHPYALWLWQMPVESWGWPTSAPQDFVRSIGGSVLNDN